ncbi:hypothetical protein [Dyella sp.]|uniref:hypothetical protein n=1 Tax=Dyella sp. TaxID=1869338 RepID=UPI002ECFD1F4
MLTSSVVATLMLHNKSCSLCSRGEPCAVAERIQDELLAQQLALRVEENATQAVASGYR